MTVAGLLLVTLVLYMAGTAGASSVEYRVKAAFLYNFTKYIDWPEQPAKSGLPFRIGVLGDGPVGDEIMRLTGKMVGARSLVVERYAGLNDAAATCEILYITDAYATQLPEIIRRTQGLPVLTVAESPVNIRPGPIIHFFMENNKVRFAVNPELARKADLTISSRLLKLALIVKGSD